VALKAQITGGYQPGPGHLFVVNRYTFSAQTLGGASTVIKQDTADATISWIPNVPGSYILSVTAKQLQGSAVAQATAQAECEVKKVAYQVTLNVSPSSGQAQAPPPNVAQRLVVSASVSPSLPNATNAFSFVVQKMNSSVVALTTIRVNRSDQSWPAEPPQPADPGLYRIAVQVVGYVTFPSGDVVVAEGQKEINYYEAKPAKAFSNVIVHNGDMTMVKPVPASQVSLTVTPLSPSPSTGDITMNATVSVPGNPSGVTNKFTFSYAPSAGGQPVSQVLTASGASQSWILSPKPAPGTYTLLANVDTRRTTDNTQLAQGSAQSANYVVAGPTYPFGWLFPVTTQNTTLGVGTKYGSASNTIAGNNINDIANKGSIKVRADNTACAQCHGGSFTQSGFCSSASLYLSKGPHSTSGQSVDQILGNLFSDWKGRNCPQ
jgi:hypothetical protein